LEPIRHRVTDRLDLHAFSPKELPELIDEYFSECLRAGILSVRIIHGKGKGFLRERLHSILRKDSRVTSFRLAPPEAGGWGATLVELDRPGGPP